VFTMPRPFVPCALLLAGCGSAVSQPAAKSHPAGAYEVVPYPPPSALVEIVPAKPHAEAVWVDGYWVWRGRYYVWERGGWVQPRDQTFVGKWHARYRDDGTLLFAPTHWYDARGRIIEAPPFLLPAATPPTEETAEPATIP
jgi:hypothetical protein